MKRLATGRLAGKIPTSPGVRLPRGPFASSCSHHPIVADHAAGPTHEPTRDATRSAAGAGRSRRRASVEPSGLCAPRASGLGPRSRWRPRLGLGEPRGVDCFAPPDRPDRPQAAEAVFGTAVLGQVGPDLGARRGACHPDGPCRGLGHPRREPDPGHAPVEFPPRRGSTRLPPTQPLLDLPSPSTGALSHPGGPSLPASPSTTGPVCALS